MNQHFLFNALNSIQQMILANEEMVATRYLSRFSKLLRSILIHSDKETITLKEELDILKLYVELESVRFKEAFSYEIYCDEEIDTDEVKIPTLLIQPFVENAIWHGLMHKEGSRSLKISFTEMDDYVQCVIEDNGIGRQKSAQIKLTSGSDKNHTGKGIQVSIERLKAMHKNGGASGSMMIKDLVDPDGAPIGTRVEINLPIQN
jgi:LytS/YehU family sensor histidine kinase